SEFDADPDAIFFEGDIGTMLGGVGSDVDIPFAAGYLWSLYFLSKGLVESPNLPRKLIFKIGLTIGLTMGIRVGGVLLWGYLGLFYAIRYLQLSKRTWQPALWLRLLGQATAITAIAYTTMICFWPWAQIHPLTGPWQAIQAFSRFSEYHHSFFNGQYVLNTQIPRTYTLQWLILTLPEFVFAGLAAWVIGLKQRSTASLQHLLLLFSGLFPVGYTVVSHTPLYDGIRHLLFALPPLVILAAVGLDNMLKMFVQAKKYLATAIGLLLGMVGFEMVRLHPHQYIYFNWIFAGKVEQAQSNYETDYWVNSIKQGLAWIDANPRWHPGDRKLRLGSLFPERLALMADPNHIDCNVSPDTADLYMGGTRYDYHRTIPGEVVHIIRVETVPLLYIIRPDSSYQNDPFFSNSPAMHYRKARFYEEANKMEAARQAYERVIQCHSAGAPSSILPDHLFVRIGNVYLSLERYQDALIHYLKAAKTAPQSGLFYNNIGVTYSRLKNHEAARMWMQAALDVEPTYFSAHVNLGELWELDGKDEKALEAYLKARGLRPDTAYLHDRIGRLLYRLKRFDSAIRSFQKAVVLQPDSASVHYNLGTAQMGQKAYTKAIPSFQQVVAIDPKHFDAYYTLGKLYSYQARYPEAIIAYQKAIAIQPNHADVYSDLGAIYVQVGQLAEARAAFKKALTIDPNHKIASKRLEVLSR
ncbi:MAG: tetratricopeptide repeat protein, partial [bacterium]|nr:tetratricopeptide repeat protein [bacterium]